MDGDRDHGLIRCDNCHHEVVIGQGMCFGCGVVDPAVSFAGEESDGNVRRVGAGGVAA